MTQYEKIIDKGDLGMKDMLNHTIDFGKLTKRQNMVKMTKVNPHDQRFETFECFPKILSQNKKLAVDFNLKKTAPRHNLMNSMGVSEDMIFTPGSGQYDKKYTLVEKKIGGIVRGFGSLPSKNKQLEEIE